MSKRSDIHRPSAIETNDYIFVAFDYYGPYADKSFDGERKIFGEHMQKTGGKYSTHDHGGTCHVCGATALYVAKFYHPKTNTYIATGEECADKIFGQNNLDFASKRKIVAGNKQFAAGKAKAEKSLSDNNLSKAWDIYKGVAQWTIDGRVGVSSDERENFTYEERTITDIIHKLIRYGSISDKQWEFLAKLVQKFEERPAIEAARKEINAKSNYIGSVGDKIEFEAVVNFITGYDSQFGYITVTGLTDNNGNIIIHKGSKPHWEKGDTVTVKATIKGHNDRNGAKQTIITRPKVLARKELAA